jgi:hypothetical protein
LPPKKTPKSTGKQPAKIGKVTPSSEVKALKFKPLAKDKLAPPPAKKALSPAKNPFTTFGEWDSNSISEIDIVFPFLTSKEETTNSLTRESTPEGRFWKGLITFKYATYASNTIRFNGVQIPYHDGSGYGESFVYVCLPGDVAAAFADAGKSKRPTIVNEKSLVPDGKRWWKIANNLTDVVGIIGADGKFHAKSLASIFETSASGVTVNIVARFYCKASTTDKKNISASTPCTVALAIDRAYLVDIGVSVEKPVRLSKKKQKEEPLATRGDLVTDDLLKRMASIGMD